MAGGMSSANFTCCFLRARLALFNEISISQKKKKIKQTNKRSKERKKNREKLSTQNCAQPLILE